MPVTSFSLATHRRWNDQDGNRQERVEWHNVVCFARQAEIAGGYLSCGQPVFVEGRIRTRSWDDRQTGEKKYRTEVVCQNFQMLGRKGDESSGYGGGRPSGGYQGGGPDLSGGASDDDIPF